MLAISHINFKISTQKKLQLPRIELDAAGFQSKYANHCAAPPTRATNLIVWCLTWAICLQTFQDCLQEQIIFWRMKKLWQKNAAIFFISTRSQKNLDAAVSSEAVNILFIIYA